jgi:hypothetical protein
LGAVYRLIAQILCQAFKCGEYEQMTERVQIMRLTDASNFEIFSATIDEEYTAAEIERAAGMVGISENDVLGQKAQRELVDWLEENRDEVIAARSVKP